MQSPIEVSSLGEFRDDLVYECFSELGTRTLQFFSLKLGIYFYKFLLLLRCILVESKDQLYSQSLNSVSFCLLCLASLKDNGR